MRSGLVCLGGMCSNLQVQSSLMNGETFYFWLLLLLLLRSGRLPVVDMWKCMQQCRDTPQAAIRRRLVIFIFASLVGFSIMPAMVSGATSDAALFADAWETLLADARAQDRQCGGESYAASPPLTWNDRLGAAAQTHSEDMAQSGRMSHEGSRGETLADRLDAVGFKPRAWAENVAAGQPDAATVVAAWLDSPGHCANIMSAAYTEFGAGVHRDASGRRYWTLVLASPRD